MSFVRVGAALGVEQAEELARLLATALSTRRIFEQDHDRSRDALEAITKSLDAYFGAEGAESQLRLTVSEGALLYEGVPLDSKRYDLDRDRVHDGSRSELAERLEKRKRGGLVIRPGVNADTLKHFLEWLLGHGADDADQHFECIDVLNEGAGEGDHFTEERRASILDGVPDFRMPLRIHRAATEVLTRIMEGAREGKPLDYSEVKEVAGWAAEAAFDRGSQLVAPAQILANDPFTFQHSVNVFLIATTLLQPFVSSPTELTKFAQAALLHDVGKSKIPPEILEKKGALTDEEFAVIRKHPEYGAEILQTCREAESVAIHVAYCHHMRDNGYGYPQPRLPIKPGPVSNAVQVADMFEALTADRPYQKSLSVAETVDIIMGTPGMETKKNAIGVLLDRLTNAPPGSEVILNTGEHAVVISVRADSPKRPVVQITTNHFGAPLAQPLRVDLAREDTGDPTSRCISKVILKPATRRAEAERDAAQDEA